LFLDAQRRVAEAETDYHLNRTRYSLASKNVHFVKGTLLDYDGVFLAEGPWPCEAHLDAAEREALRGRPRPLNYASARTQIVGNGPFDQHPSSPAVSVQPAADRGPTPQNESLLPPGDVQPLPTPAEKTAPNNGTGTQSPAKNGEVQPANANIELMNGAAEKQYPVVGAAYSDPAAQAVPQVELRPSSATPSTH
jgi:hypothetical protein